MGSPGSFEVICRFRDTEFLTCFVAHFKPKSIHPRHSEMFFIQIESDLKACVKRSVMIISELFICSLFCTTSFDYSAELSDGKKSLLSSHFVIY